MTVSKQNKQVGGVSNVVAAVAGAVVGAGVAVAGAIALSNEKNQEKLKGALTETKNKLTNFGKDMSSKIEDGKGVVEDKVKKTASVVKDASSEAKNIWKK